MIDKGSLTWERSRRSGTEAGRGGRARDMEKVGGWVGKGCCCADGAPSGRAGAGAGTLADPTLPPWPLQSPFSDPPGGVP